MQQLLYGEVCLGQLVAASLHRDLVRLAKARKRERAGFLRRIAGDIDGGAAGHADGEDGG